MPPQSSNVRPKSTAEYTSWRFTTAASTFAARDRRYFENVADVNQLPEDLSELKPSALERAANVRDNRLSPLFRRWPSLNRLELSELKRLYNERLRLARYAGKRRRRSR
jgi:hypothetical protein